MAKVITLPTQTLVQRAPKKGSVRFDAKRKDVDKERAVTGSFYLNRNAAKKAGIKDLDDAEEIEVTVKVRMASNGKKKQDDEDEDEEEDGSEDEE